MNEADGVVLARTGTPFAAHAIVAVLADAGIEARAVETTNRALDASLNPKLAGVPVLVHEGDLERAQRTLREQDAAALDIDWDTVDLGTPEEHIDARGRTAGGMPLPARIALAAAILMALLGLVGGVVVLFL